MLAAQLAMPAAIMAVNSWLVFKSHSLEQNTTWRLWELMSKLIQTTEALLSLHMDYNATKGDVEKKLEKQLSCYCQKKKKKTYNSDI